MKNKRKLSPVLAVIAVVVVIVGFVIYHGKGKLLTGSVCGISSECSTNQETSSAPTNNLLTNASLALDSYAANNFSNAIVQFTMTNKELSDYARIGIFFPSGFDASGINNFSCNLNGGLAIEHVYNDVSKIYVKRMGGGSMDISSAIVCEFSGIKTPLTAGQTANGLVQTDSGGWLFEDGVLPGVYIAVNSGGNNLLTNSSMVLDGYFTNSITNASVQFRTTSNVLPADAKMGFFFPAGFDTSGINNFSCNLNGGLKLEHDLDVTTVYIKRTGGGSVDISAPIECNFIGIKTPTVAGYSANGLLETFDGNDVRMEDGAFAGVDIVAKPYGW